jgi:hypothetical protein
VLHSRYIIVADSRDGKTVTLYQGPSSAEADRVLQAAVKEGKADSVIEFAHPLPSRVRFPAQEKADAERRAFQTEEAKNAGARQLQVQAQEKRERARQLTAEAKRLETEASAHLDKPQDKTNE